MSTFKKIVLATLVVVLAGSALCALFMVSMRDRILCNINFQIWETAFRQYAREHDGRLPPLAPYPDLWVPDLRVLEPDNLWRTAMFCPGEGTDNPWLAVGAPLPETDAQWRELHVAFAEHYVYLGSPVARMEELEAIVSARRAGNLEAGEWEENPSNFGDKPPRALLFIERFDPPRHGFRPFGVPGGGNVVGLGHGAWFRERGEFPMTDETLALLYGVDPTHPR